MTDIERQMREYLDGWFTTIDHERQRTVTTEVPLDFMPDHRPKWMPDEDEDRPSPNAHRWTEPEDEVLLELRRKGLTFQQIADEMEMSKSSVQKRHELLCKHRNLTPPPKVPGVKKFSREVELQVVAMKKSGLEFAEIATQFGMKRHQVYEVYRRYLGRMEREGAAA